MTDAKTLIKNWCAACGMPEPSSGECHALEVALSQPSGNAANDAAQTLGEAIYKAAQKMGIANADHTSLSVPQLLHLLECMSGHPSGNAGELPPITRFNPMAGMGMNPHPNGLYVYYADHERALAAQAQPPVSRPEGVTLDGCLETLFVLGEYLGVDYAAARKGPGAPSEVYIKAIEARAALAQQTQKAGSGWLPLPVIDALNAATGNNEWQGDNTPADLIGPACAAIAALAQHAMCRGAAKEQK